MHTHSQSDRRAVVRSAPIRVHEYTWVSPQMQITWLYNINNIICRLITHNHQSNSKKTTTSTTTPRVAIVTFAKAIKTVAKALFDYYFRALPIYSGKILSEPHSLVQRSRDEEAMTLLAVTYNNTSDHTLNRITNSATTFNQHLLINERFLVRLMPSRVWVLYRHPLRTEHRRTVQLLYLCHGNVGRIV